MQRASPFYSSFLAYTVILPNVHPALFVPYFCSVLGAENEAAELTLEMAAPTDSFLE